MLFDAPWVAQELLKYRFLASEMQLKCVRGMLNQGFAIFGKMFRCLSSLAPSFGSFWMLRQEALSLFEDFWLPVGVAWADAWPSWDVLHSSFDVPGRHYRNTTSHQVALGTPAASQG